MKFIRNARFRERIIDISTKALLLAVSVLFCLWMISGARASTAEITSIQQGPAGGGEYAIDFAFSSPVSKGDVAVEFQRNFIQVSLKGVSAYPARTEKLNHPMLEKVFTYQYQPDLARARVLLKGQASEVEGTSRWEVNGQNLRIFVKGNGSVAKVEAKKEIKKEAKDAVKTKSAAAKSAPAASEDPEDAAVVQQLVEESKKGPVSAASSPGSTGASSLVSVVGGKDPKKPEAAGSSSASSTLANTEEQPIFGSASASGSKDAGAHTSPIARTLASLLLVVGIIGAGAVGYRRFVLGKGGLSFQRQNRMIETITTQSIGPKRSVAIIRVLDQYMVVGMAGDNMNLLANLGNSVNLDKYDDTGIGASFADSFQSAVVNPTTVQKEKIEVAAPAKADFRSMIKKRMEGFKPL